MIKGNSKTTYRIIFWIMIYCILTETIGAYIPIWFTNPKVAGYFNQTIFILILISVPVSVYQIFYIPQKDNWKFSALMSSITTFVVFIFLGIIVLFHGFALTTDIAVIYVDKNNPKVKIIHQYVDLGALGDGNKVVLRRDLTSFLKYEKLIDTNVIKKTDWIKQP